ncbi:MAG: hypothetical protein QW035_04190 [Candidatus Anstonellales archaeon]
MATEEYVLEMGTIAVMFMVAVLSLSLISLTVERAGFIKLKERALSLSLAISQNDFVEQNLSEPYEVSIGDGYLRLKDSSYSVIVPYFGYGSYSNNSTTHICIKEGYACEVQ